MKNALIWVGTPSSCTRFSWRTTRNLSIITRSFSLNQLRFFHIWLKRQSTLCLHSLTFKVQLSPIIPGALSRKFTEFKSSSAILWSIKCINLHFKSQVLFVSVRTLWTNLMNTIFSKIHCTASSNAYITTEPKPTQSWSLLWSWRPSTRSSAQLWSSMAPKHWSIYATLFRKITCSRFCLQKLLPFSMCKALPATRNTRFMPTVRFCLITAIRCPLRLLRNWPVPWLRLRPKDKNSS